VVITLSASVLNPDKLLVAVVWITSCVINWKYMRQRPWCLSCFKSRVSQQEEVMWSRPLCSSGSHLMSNSIGKMQPQDQWYLTIFHGHDRVDIVLMLHWSIKMISTRCATYTTCSWIYVACISRQKQTTEKPRWMTHLCRYFYDSTNLIVELLKQASNFR